MTPRFLARGACRGILGALDFCRLAALPHARSANPGGTAMAHRFPWALAVSLAGVLSLGLWAAPLKPRIVVLTDISPAHVEPDDMESMIRLLVHADLFEIEGLVATTGWSTGGDNAQWTNLIHEVINAYERDLPNLRKRSRQTGQRADTAQQEIGDWPSPEYLRSRTVVGSQKRGMRFVGEGNDSAGSELIIRTADEKDDRPVWVLGWGGANTLAQAIWRVRKDRSGEQVDAFLHKIRCYTITDQDGTQKPGNVIEWSESSHQWMRREFEEKLRFLWDESAWKYQNGTGRAKWDEYAAAIQGHGQLGAIYPKYRYGVEGDTPSFLYLMPNGLNNPENPGNGGWGGTFTWGTGPDNVTRSFVNQPGTRAQAVSRKYETRFYPAIFNDFAARMDWAKYGAGNRNPVLVINGDRGLDPLRFMPAPGVAVNLDASASHDPDGDHLKFSWWVLSEAGTYARDINIDNPTSTHPRIEVPADSAGLTFHVICEVTDDGTRPLTSYRRIVFEPRGPARKH